MNDFTRDLLIDGQLGTTVDTFEGAGTGRLNLVGTSLFPTDTNYTLSYTASPETIRFAINGMSDSYAAADRTDVGPQRLYRRAGSPDLTVGLQSGRTAAYVITINSAIYTVETRGGVSVRRRSLRIALAGRPTLPVDLPTLFGGLTFRGAALAAGGVVDQDLYAMGDTSIFTISSEGAMQGWVSALAFAGQLQVILEFTGTLDRATGRFQGTVSDNRTGFAGVFRGQMFGPTGAEIGLVYRAVRASDGAMLTGDYIGGR